MLWTLQNATELIKWDDSRKSTLQVHGWLPSKIQLTALANDWKIVPPILWMINPVKHLENDCCIVLVQLSPIKCHDLLVRNAEFITSHAKASVVWGTYTKLCRSSLYRLRSATHRNVDVGYFHGPTYPLGNITFRKLHKNHQLLDIEHHPLLPLIKVSYWVHS